MNHDARATIPVPAAQLSDAALLADWRARQARAEMHAIAVRDHNAFAERLAGRSLKDLKVQARALGVRSTGARCALIASIADATVPAVAS